MSSSKELLASSSVVPIELITLYGWSSSAPKNAPFSNSLSPHFGTSAVLDLVLNRINDQQFNMFYQWWDDTVY